MALTFLTVEPVNPVAREVFVAQYSTHKQQVGDVARLPRPDGMSRTQWKGVRAYLMAIAKHYPNPYPSQERLANLVGCDVRSIHRYQKLAVAAGLLLVMPDAGVKRSLRGRVKTNKYHIVLPDNCRAVLPDNCPTKAPQEPHFVSLPAPRATPLSPKEACLVPPSSARMARWKEPERQVGPESKPPPARKAVARPTVTGDMIVASGVRERGRIAPPKQPPWRRLTDHFVIEWTAMIEHTKRDDHLRDVRLLDSLRHCQRYLNAHFLGPNALTPTDESKVRELIGHFIEDAYRGRVRIKDGQSAWMAFTGAWGRENRSYIGGSTEDDFDRYFGGKS